MIGRRIVAVEQERTETNQGRVWALLSITLDNGTVLAPLVAEMDGDYAVELRVHKPKPGRQKT